DPEDPDGPMAMMHEGDALRAAGRLDAATDAFKKAEARLSKLASNFPEEPGYLDAWARSDHSLGVVLRKLRRFEESRDRLGRADARYAALDARFPRDARYRQKRAAFFGEEGRLALIEREYSLALEYFDRSLSIEPENEVVLNNAAWLLATS